MYKIEKKDFGYKLTFSDTIPASEMKLWVEESKKTLVAAPHEFGIFVDMRTLHPLVDEAKKLMEEGQKLYKQKGMKRSVVILSSAIIAMQFKRLARESGIYQFERYIDASSVADWEKVGIAWITNGVDPDK